MKRILLLKLVFMIAVVFQAMAQRTVSGLVLDEAGEPIPGANVLIKGTTNGTTTDIDGRYRISVPGDGGILVFSFIGMSTQEVEIGVKSILDVTLGNDVKQLSEVVVTAQGIVKTKNELSYAAQSVSGTTLSSIRDNNVMNSLSGKVSGVQITKNNSMGGSTNVIIRGYKSLTGNNQALFVVDGVPVDNSTNNADGVNRGYAGYDYGNTGADINPDDIESVTVLKGPAATALYGSRAANGVVYITTKKGRSKGLGVTLNAGVSFSIVNKNTFPTYQNQYGAGYGRYYGPDYNGYFDQADVDGDGVQDFIVPTYEDASVGAPFNPNLMVYQWNAFGDPTSPYYGQKTAWKPAAHSPVNYFRTGVIYNNSVMVDGGSDKGTFKLGYTRTDEKGVQPNSDMTKNYINFNSTYKIIKRLTASASVNFTQQTTTGRYATGYGGNNNISSFREWWETNVDIVQLEKAYHRTNDNITWNWSSGLPSSTGLIYWDNPYFAAYQNYASDNRYRYLGYARLDYQVTDWLNIMGRASLDFYETLQEERTAVGSVVYQPGEYLRRNITYHEHNFDLLATAKKQITPDISLSGSLGTNIRRTSSSGISANTNGGLVVPGIYALSNTVSQIEAPTESYSDIKVDGFYADASIGYQEYLYLNGSFRRDVSSTLPKGNNGYNYFQGSLSFVFSKFIPENSILNYGKLRLNYAEVGNSAPFNSLVDLYDKPTGFGSVALFSKPDTKNNSQLEPERTKSYEIGSEFTFIDGRIHLDVNYFSSKTIDQIMPVSVSTATGYSSKYVNAGEVKNYGFEVTLGLTPVKVGDFKWDMSINWTRIRNKVISLYGDVSNLTLGSFVGGGSLNAPKGHAFGTIYGYNYVYTDGKRTVDSSTGRYVRSTTATNPIGSIVPDWTGGLQNTFTYKSVSLSVLIDVKHGGDVYSLDMLYGLATGLYKETAGKNELGNPKRNSIAEGGGILLKGVNTDGNPNTTRLAMDAYPLMGTTSVKPTKAYVYDASYIKVREAMLTYSLPSAIVSKLDPLRSLSVSAVGRNLFIIHKNLPYADPEDNLGAGNIQGYQVGSQPAFRNIGFNVKATF